MDKRFSFRLSLGFFCVLCALFVSHTALLGLLELKKEHIRNIALDDGYAYINIQHETNPLELQDTAETLEQFKRLYEQLRQTPYTYYEIYQQPLLLAEPGGRLPCLQISQNVQDDFGLTLSEGRLLNEDDFLIEKDERIPAIMGSNYKALLSVGDCFTAEYLFSDFNFEVIGFLDEGSALSISTSFVDLNGAVVIPSFAFLDLPASEREYVTQKIHCANKTSGKIKVMQEDFAEAYGAVRQLLTDSAVGSYSFAFSSYENALTAKGYSLNAMLAAAFLLLLGTAAVLLYLLFRYLYGAAAVPFGVWAGRAAALLAAAYALSVFFSVKILAVLGFGPQMLLHQIYLVALVSLAVGAAGYGNARSSRKKAAAAERKTEESN